MFPPTPTLLFSFLAGEDVIRAGATILALEMKLHFENGRDILDLLAVNREISFYYAVLLDLGVSLWQQLSPYPIYYDSWEFIM